MPPSYSNLYGRTTHCYWFAKYMIVIKSEIAKRSHKIGQVVGADPPSISLPLLFVLMLSPRKDA